MGNWDPDTPAKDAKLFVENTTIEDEELMQAYKAKILTTTATMTGLDIRARLNRIEAEFKRVEELKVQLGRLKKLTKEAVLAAVGDEEKEV